MAQSRAKQPPGESNSGMEYDPAPPFDSGHPDRAPEIKLALMSARYEKFRAVYRAGIQQAA